MNFEFASKTQDVRSVEAPQAIDRSTADSRVCRLSLAGTDRSCKEWPVRRGGNGSFNEAIETRLQTVK